MVAVSVEMKGLRSPPWALTPPVIRRTSARPGGGSPTILHQGTLIRKRCWVPKLPLFGPRAMSNRSR